MFSITGPKYIDEKLPYFEHDHITNNVIINTDVIVRGRCDKIIPLFRKYKPRMIWAHPNILCVLAEYLLSSGNAPLDIPLITVYAEKIYPHIMRTLKRAFNSKFMEYYGNRENSIAAWGFADGRFFEVSEYCHLEIEKRDSENRGKGAGSIITTALHNYAMPLIRYDSDDVGKWLGYINNGIPYPALELTGGRGKDLLLSRDGLIVPYWPHYFDNSENIKFKKYQVEQISLDKVILRIVPLPEFIREKDEPALLEIYKKVTAGKFEITIEYVDDIPFTEGGKYPVAISPFAVKHFEEVNLKD